MRTIHKFLISLLISVILLGVFIVLGYTGLFQTIETQFYNQRIVENKRERIHSIYNQFTEYNDQNYSRLSLLLSNSSFQKVFELNQKAEDINKLNNIIGSLEDELIGFRYLRIVDYKTEGQKIHFSSNQIDIRSSSAERRIYDLWRNSEDYNDTIALEDNDESVIFDDSSSTIIYRIPMKDNLGLEKGIALIYFSSSGFKEFLSSKGLSSSNSLIQLFGEKGIIIDIKEEQLFEVSEKLLELQSSRMVQPHLISENIENENFYIMNENFSDYDLITDLSISIVIKESELQLNPLLIIVLLTLFFTTFFLISFLLLNIRQDRSLIIASRIKKFQLNFLIDYLDNKSELNWEMWERDMRSRRDQVRKEFKKGLGRFKKDEEDRIDTLIDNNWDEIITVLSKKKEEKEETKEFDQKRIEQILQRALKNVNFTVSSDSIQQAAPSKNKRRKPVDVEEIDELEDLGEPIEVEDLSDDGDLEDMEDLGEPIEVEDLSDDGDLEDMEDLGEPIEVEDLSDDGDLEDMEDLGEPIEVEDLSDDGDLEDLEDLGEPIEVEDLSDDGDLEDLEDLGEPIEVEDLSDDGDLEDLEDLGEPIEVEDLSDDGDLEDLEDLGEPIEVEDLSDDGDLEDLEDLGEPIEVEDLSDDGDLEDMEDLGEPIEVEDLSDDGDLEDLEDLGEPIEVEDLSDDGDLEDLEDLGEPIEVEDLSDDGDLEDLEDLGEPIEVEHLSDDGDLEEIEEISAIEKEETVTAEELEELFPFVEYEELSKIEEEDLEAIPVYSGAEEALLMDIGVIQNPLDVIDINGYSVNKDDSSYYDTPGKLEDVTESFVSDHLDFAAVGALPALDDIEEMEELEDVDDLEEFDELDELEELEELVELEELEDDSSQTSYLEEIPYSIFYNPTGKPSASDIDIASGDKGTSPLTELVDSVIEVEPEEEVDLVHVYSDDLLPQFISEDKDEKIIDEEDEYAIFKAVEGGFDFDSYASSRKDEYKALIGITREVNAVGGIIFANENDRYEMELSLGIGQDLIGRLEKLLLIEDVQKITDKRNLIYIQNTLHEELKSIILDADRRFLKSILFIPVFYNKNKAYLFLGFKKTISDIEKLIKTIV